MAINRDDLEMAKWVLDQAIYQGTALTLQDTMTIRAFLSALEEHEDRPAENVKSQEWRAMVYRKLLDDPAALQQFTMQAMERFTPEQIAMMLHPQVRQAVIQQYDVQRSDDDDDDRDSEEILVNALHDLSDLDLFETLKDEGRVTDIVDYFIDYDPDYVKRELGIDDDSLQEAIDEAHKEGYEQGVQEGYNQGLEEAGE